MMELNNRIVEAFPFPHASIELRLPAVQIIPGISTAREI